MKPKQTILVVDDNPTNVRILSQALERGGYRILEACDGLRAVQVATAQLPDLILLDIEMPGRDGFEVCEILNAQKSTRAIPIVFLTARDEAEDLQRAFSSGGRDYITKPFSMAEVRARVSVHLELRDTQQELLQRNKQLEELSRIAAEHNIELARMARTDALTELLNRSAWEEAVRAEHNRCQRANTSYCILMIDIDQFKLYNDTQGHQAGDEALRQVAQCIQSTCRPEDVVGRYGGEEFVVLAPETQLNGVVALAERIRASVFDLQIAHPASTSHGRVTISVGLGESGCESWEHVLKQADDALYLAKEHGRNQVCTGGQPNELLANQEPRCAQPDRAALANLAVESHTTVALLVSDDDESKNTCTRCLKNDECQIALSPVEADLVHEAQQCAPDVIILDLDRSEGETLQSIEQLRGNESTASIPIIVIGSSNHEQSALSVLHCGGDEYLTKPINEAELSIRVRVAVDRAKERMQLLMSHDMRGEQSRVLSGLLDYCREVSACDDLRKVAEETVKVAGSLTGCRRVSVMLPSDTDETLSIAASVGIPESDVAGIEVPFGSSVSGRVFNTGRTIIMNVADELGSLRTAEDAACFASVPLLCSALGQMDNVQGVLNLTQRVCGKPFTGRDLDYVDMISKIAGTAILSILTQQARDSARDLIMVALAKLAASHDEGRAEPVERVGLYSSILARELRQQGRFVDQLDDEFIKTLEHAAPLHDIGKVAIPDRILLKPAKLSPAEMETMRTHSEIGAATIRSVREQSADPSMLKMAEEIAFCHHEWFDGTGYPRRLKGDEIPLSARIVAIADVYDALTSQRVYKDAETHAKATTILMRSSGTQFDPAIIEAFLHSESKFRDIANTSPDEFRQPGAGRDALSLAEAT